MGELAYCALAQCKKGVQKHVCRVLFYIVETFFRRRKLKLSFKFMIDHDKIFGPHGERGWPGDVDEANTFLKKERALAPHPLVSVSLHF